MVLLTGLACFVLILTALYSAKEIVLGNDMPNRTVIDAVLLYHFSHRFPMHQMIINDANSFLGADLRTCIAPPRLVTEDILIVLGDGHLVSRFFLGRPRYL